MSKQKQTTLPIVEQMVRDAYLSEDRKYRYTLIRTWDPKVPRCAIFIGLNPSTADESEDDPTIRRCINFAKGWECGGILMVNLFALRATDPKDMKESAEPVGRENNETLRFLRTLSTDVVGNKVICAWGNHGDHGGRAEHVVENILEGVPVYCFGLTKLGAPRHPLYLKSDTHIQNYRLARADWKKARKC